MNFGENNTPRSKKSSLFKVLGTGGRGQLSKFLTKKLKGWGGMEEYSEKNIKELENQLLSKIGYFSPRKKDAIQYEKVNRYLYLVKLMYELKERLHEDGLVITVHNGQQRFQKANSLIKEINTTSNQLLAIERSFDFEVENSPVEKIGPGSELL